MNVLRAASHAPPAASSPPRLRPGSGTQEKSSPLVAPRGSEAEQLGDRYARQSPVLLYCLTILAGYLVLAAAMVGLGFLLVDVVLPVHAIGHDDEAVNVWLASHRSPALSDASYVGSMIGDIPFIPALVIVTALGAALLRRWRVFAFIVGAILIEVATYRVTSLIVHRERPTVPRLNPEHLPLNQSFPSGHVAASMVVYAGLALLITAHLRHRGLRMLVWIVAIALPLIVAFSRMYRGMHHPTDVASGALMGVAALVIALFAVRAAGEAARRRSGASGRREEA